MHRKEKNIPIWEHGPTSLGILAPVFLVSFTAIGWQIALMRCLLIARYHHFSFLVISCALLGFGAGGTGLYLGRGLIDRHGDAVFRWGILGFALSMPGCFRLGELLPVNVYFPPVLMTETLGWWCLFWLVHLAPFVCAGTLIGLALMMGKGRVHTIYAANLVGSAAGALGTIMLTYFFAPNALVVPLALTVVFSGVFLLRDSAGILRIPYASCLIVSAVGGMVTWVLPADAVFPLNIDQYKTLAYLNRLVEQGSARKERTLHGPRGQVDLFSGPHFHTMLSLGASEAPPAMDIVVKDGFQAGAILASGKEEHARFLMSTLSAIPYRLVQPERILILGESGALYVMMARLSQARSIVVVNPDENVLKVLREHPSRVLADPRIRVMRATPRSFLDQACEKFDIIHLAALEGFSPGSGGIGGLREDYLATKEGFEQCLHALTPHGLVCAVRGIQNPARDNIKIIATWIEVLHRRHEEDPGRFLLMARDELGFSTLCTKSPLTARQISDFRRMAGKMSWDTEWFPGIKPEETNRVHILPGPAQERYSWYQDSIRRLLSGDRESFYRAWICNVRPASDDRPFFYDFFRWASLGKLRAAFGPLWPARAEMGFLILISAAVWTALVSLALLVLPLPLMNRRHTGLSDASMLTIIGYFAALGAAFMFLEMSYIQIFTRFLGDPILAAALIIGGFLFFAGTGSMLQPKVTERIPGGILVPVICIGILVVSETFFLAWIFQRTSLMPQAAKVLLGLLLIAPPAFFMGCPFPWGMSILHRKSSEAIPIAWAVNGFASVVSSSVAVILAMTYGFKMLVGIAAALYVSAGIVGETFRRQD